MAKTTDGHRIEDHFGEATEMVETKQCKQLGTTEMLTNKKGE
jgi:hypothetical protein